VAVSLPAIEGPFRLRGLDTLWSAPQGARATAMVTGEAQRVVLPPMPIGEAMLRRMALPPTDLPVAWDETEYQSHIPWVCTFEGVEVHGDGGIVLADGAIVADTLAQCVPGRQGLAETPQGPVLLRGGPARGLPGAWLSLLCGNHWNHYHWLMDGIGRLAAATPPVWDGIAGVLVPEALTPVAAEALAATGLAARLPLLKVAADDRVAAQRLVVPWTLAGGFWPHPALPRHLAGLLPALPPNPVFPRRLYVDRTGSGNRRLENEAEVIAALRRLGVMPVRLEGLSFATQVALFRHAELVVAPHGAGLANLVFAPPGCAVVELVMDAYPHWAFRRLAALGGLRYDCVIGRAPPAPPGTWLHGRSWQVPVTYVQAAAAAALEAQG
jgi:capsular polysaccharide biosynthesis protein